MAKRLEQTRIITNIAPMLGLMGTLIPLGPALVALSQGDVVQLAHN
nr:MotA/TolQ/ExbB proton channel family protein [Methanomethylovorans sp.]